MCAVEAVEASFVASLAPVDPVAWVAEVGPALDVAGIAGESRVLVRSQAELMLAERLFGRDVTARWEALAERRRLPEVADTFVVVGLCAGDGAGGDCVRAAWGLSSLGADPRCRLVVAAEGPDGDAARRPDIVVIFAACGDGDDVLRSVLARVERGVATIVVGGPALGPLHLAGAYVVSAGGGAEALARALDVLWREPRVRLHLQRNPDAAFPSRSQVMHARMADVADAASADGDPPGADSRTRRRRLHVDVSEIAARDLGTGIQRVVRAQLLALLQAPPHGVDVWPVRIVATENGVVWVRANRYLQQLYGRDAAHAADAGDAGDTPIEPRPGDVLYMPDLAPGAVIAAHRAGAFAALRARGVRIHALVHDVLPLTSPQYFLPGTAVGHAAWLRAVIDSADQVICISAAVAASVRAWADSDGLGAKRLPPLAVLHHGADIEATRPTTGLPPDAPTIIAAIRRAPTFLMVGSVEPRKGHLQALGAFERLWGRGFDINLVIVGRHIWRDQPPSICGDIPRVVASLRSHRRLGTHLFWVEDASDAWLGALYTQSTCLLAASADEGFALPLVEAARHGLPIVARDIAVMREVTAGHAFFFAGTSPDTLADALAKWLQLHREGKAPASDGMPILTWRENAMRLKMLLFGERDGGHAI